MARLKRPETVCTQCGGTGTTPLSDEMWDTLKAVRFFKATGAGTIATSGTRGWMENVGAVSMRLLRLMRLGFLTREKQGKFWIYKPKEGK